MAVSSDYTDNLDLSSDYTIWDAPEEIAFTFRDKNAVDVDCDVAAALRLPVTIKEVEASGGAYTTLDAVWLIAGKLLLGGQGSGTPPILPRRNPQPGDKITSAVDGTKWTALDVSYSPLDGTYRFTCRNLVLAAGLKDRVTIWKPQTRQDAASGRVVTERVPVAEDLAAKIQETGGEPTEAHGKRGQRTRYTIYLEEYVAMKDTYTVEDLTTQQVYEYVSHSKTDQIDALMEVVVERAP